MALCSSPATASSCSYNIRNKHDFKFKSVRTNLIFQMHVKITLLAINHINKLRLLLANTVSQQDVKCCNNGFQKHLQSLYNICWPLPSDKMAKCNNMRGSGQKVRQEIVWKESTAKKKKKTKTKLWQLNKTLEHLLIETCLFLSKHCCMIRAERGRAGNTCSYINSSACIFFPSYF